MEIPFFARVSLRRVRRASLPLLALIFTLSLGVLLRSFYTENTMIVPDEGGIYIEGSVGQFRPLIPWFTVTNDVNRDIVSLVFSGLLKYDPDSKKIKDDLATLLVSDGGKNYTVKLKEDLLWHDHSLQSPHPVTSDDIIFTFQTIQSPDFPNPILRQNFLGVAMERIDDRTVRFRLDQPYSFFASNLTIGLLPKRSFEGIPPAKLEQALDFGFAPVGAGPYKFKSLVQTELSTEITLERFERPLTPAYKLHRIIFRIFPEYNSLLSDIRNLHGIRLVPRNTDGNHIIPRHFQAVQYSLPQYVALFFNLDRGILSDPKLRLGLQLGTDKRAIVDTVDETLIVDTPLLELDLKDWRYSYDQEAAQGALFASSWHLPEKVRLQRMLEIRETNRVGTLQTAPVVLLDTGATLMLTGSVLQAGSGSMLHGVPLQFSLTQTGTWTAELSTTHASGSLSIGMNIIRLADAKGKILDSAYIFRTTGTKEYKAAILEQDLVDRFVATRDAPQSLDEDRRITVADLYLEHGMLRRRLSSDPRDVRINDSGKRLSLNILTSPSPPQYEIIAKEIAKQWEALGVQVKVTVPKSKGEFEDAMLSRDYDILLFGQSLIDNLDSYPYWHSSGVQKVTGSKFDLRIDAYNLSQYSSLQADGLLEVIRTTSDDSERKDALTQLQEVLKTDIPAIFLYSPTYAYAHHADLKGVSFGSLSLHSDRFLTLHDWYIHDNRVFRASKSWWSFFPWLFSRF